MEPSYKETLPQNAQALVDHIEQFAGVEIHVKVDPSRPVSPTDPNPNRPELVFTATSAEIFLPTSNFSPHGIVHELLHTERYWLQGIPQVVPLDQNADNNWAITSSIENTLEHQVIVPRESAYGFDPYPYWAKTERALWADYPWPWMTDPFSRRKNCLLGSVSVFNLTKDDDLIAHVRECLRKEGLLKEAVRFHKRMTDVLNNKEKMLRLTIQHLAIPKTDVRFLHLDVRARQARHVAL